MPSEKIFENPPLVELIAEVRWQTPSVQIELVPNRPVFIGGQMQDPVFYEPFLRLAVDAGYTQSERLSPAGFPVQVEQPVFRFRKTDPKDTSLYQIGPGMFSANITPPYQSWEDFRPVVERGIEMLLASFSAIPDEKRPKIFALISLRYIDAFRNSLTGGGASSEFLRRTLGFEFTIPQAVSQFAADENSVQARLNYIVPLKSGHEMQINLFDAISNGEPSVIMDTVVSLAAESRATIPSAMQVLDDAHQVIRDSFLGLTTQLHQKMGIVKK